MGNGEHRSFKWKGYENIVVISTALGGMYWTNNFNERLKYKYDWHVIGLSMIIKQRARVDMVDHMDLMGTSPTATA